MFFYFRVEETCHMVFGNDERMTRRDWKTVVEGQCQTVFYENVTNFKMTERKWRPISILYVFFKDMAEDVAKLKTALRGDMNVFSCVEYAEA